MTSVALAVTDGSSMLEIAAPCDIFGMDRRDLADPWYEFRVCASAGARVGGGWRIDSACGLADLAGADLVIVPGSHDVDQPPPAELVAAVRAAYDAGSRIAAICTGAFVLAAAGLLDGHRATTHWLHAARLARLHPRVRVEPDVLYIDEGTVLTSAGKAAGIDLCLHLVRTEHGAAVANEVARRLVVAPHRPGGQAQYIAAPVATGDDLRLAELLAWANQRLDGPLTVEDLARQAKVSSRQLIRHFRVGTGTTPLRWLSTQRIQRARELLETTDHGVDRIAALTGLGTAATLRRHFHRTVGVAPDAYRRAFRRTPADTA
jgi:transcriptional regulator GlxA family with amidase domain